MKKVLIIACFGYLAIGCGSNDKPDTKPDVPEAKTEVKTMDAEATKGLDLIAKSDCLTCHKLDEQLVGPSYQAIAGKYPDTDAVADTLVEKIIKGGTGRWGQVPMTPHPLIVEGDAKMMVKYIMSLKGNHE